MKLSGAIYCAPAKTISSYQAPLARAVVVISVAALSSDTYLEIIMTHYHPARELHSHNVIHSLTRAVQQGGATLGLIGLNL